MADHKMNMQEQFFNHLSRCEYEEASSIFSDDCDFMFPGIDAVHGRRAIKRLLQMFGRRYDRLEWQAQPELYSEPDYVISRWVVDGDFKSGKLYRNEGVSVFRLNAEGKIYFFSDYFKSTDFSD